MDILNYCDEQPTLRDPILILSFSGWNDAGGAATNTASHLREELQGREFAVIESDPFFNFQDMRPIVNLDANGQRVITWPQNSFYACSTPQLSHDLIVFVGTEPHLKWNMFSHLFLGLARKFGVRLVITLGALLADVYHKSTVRVTGSSPNQALAERLGLKRSRYEGPTGIVGVLNNLFREENVPAVSVWANVPHYVNITPNPKASLALLRRVSDFLSLPLDISDLEEGVSDFDEKVDRALEMNRAVREYVEELKQRAGGEEESSDLPSGEELAKEVERFLRNRGKNEEPED